MFISFSPEIKPEGPVHLRRQLMASWPTSKPVKTANKGAAGCYFRLREEIAGELVARWPAVQGRREAGVGPQ